ncbi:YdaU family protein [Xanthomonas translucens]|uniref:YdaU family protein n=1 Tax=Xanthomonas campestris pv. translucens TaxID=343 RepID=UPI00200A1A6E|nr:YdaU family protein [Xanthomonas translucens]UPU47782.1 YdaU family protein [Xanthomonas translucens pv. undulosa]
MNYYEHHLGDYAQATAHLSFVEDAAYSRLLRKYYAEEKPLPADLRAVQRLVGARTDEEREAVQVVLEEFFLLEEDGWHNKRADSEIAKVQAKSKKAKKSAEARWNSNGSLEDFQGKANAMRTHRILMRTHRNHMRRHLPSMANAMLSSHQ